MFRNNITIVCRKIWQFKQIHLGEGVNALLKKVGLYIKNDSHLISNSPYTIKLASKLKLRCSTFIQLYWFDMQIGNLFCIFINIDENFRENLTICISEYRMKVLCLNIQSVLGLKV